MKKIFIFILCLFNILFFSVADVFALSDNNNDKVDDNQKTYSNTFLDNSLVTNLDSANVSETSNSVTLNNNEKSFIYKLGQINNINDMVYVTDDTININITTYEWYEVTWLYQSIYVANVLSNINNTIETGTVGVFLYPIGTYIDSKNELFNIDYTNNHILEVIYSNEDLTCCTKIICPINDVYLGIIVEESIYFNLQKDNTDLVSETLIESFSFETNFKSQMYDTTQPQSLTDENMYTLMSMPNYGSYANENRTVRLNAYDNYTNDDKFINEYEEIYKDNVQTATAIAGISSISDDPIINIIPKSLFISRGTYSYIGKEYGFYIKTVQDYENDNISEFIVFDIENVQPYPGRTATMPAPSITIRPVFSGTIRYTTNWGGGIVIYNSYSDPNLAIANIQIAGAINNIDELNIGDQNYNSYQDYGYAFSSFSLKTLGVGPKKDEDEVDLGFIKTAFASATFLNSGYPGVGTAISLAGKSLTSLLEFTANSYNSNNRTNYSGITQLADGTYQANYTILGNNNTNTMINNYGNLVKGYQTEVLNSDKTTETEIPLLYKTNSHYYTLEYTFCQPNASINWDSLIATSISLDIYYDGTKKVLGLFGSGEIEKKDSVIGGRIDYYNEIPSNSNGGTIQEGVIYHTEFANDENGSGNTSYNDYTPKVGSYKDFYFTPNRTFNYVIETFNRSSNSDPYLKIYDSNNNLITSNDDGGMKDPNSSNSARNSKITITLTGGETYKIRTLCYNYNAGYYEFIIKKTASLLESTPSSLNANQVTVSNDAIWYTFIPSQSAYYSLYTVGDLDTYLTLYDEYYNQFSFNDDNVNGLNAQIDFYLISGKTYYLKVQRYNMNSGTFSVYANVQHIIKTPSNATQTSYFYTIPEGSTIFYRFTPSTTKSYKFYTELYEGDPIIYLYDSSMNLITSDDDGGDEYNSSLTYTLEAGKTYFIKVRNYGNVAGYGYLFCEYN